MGLHSRPIPLMDCTKAPCLANCPISGHLALHRAPWPAGRVYDTSKWNPGLAFDPHRCPLCLVDSFIHTMYMAPWQAFGLQRWPMHMPMPMPMHMATKSFQWSILWPHKWAPCLTYVHNNCPHVLVYGPPEWSPGLAYGPHKVFNRLGVAWAVLQTSL